MSEEVSVAVGIRIRPFNEREKKLGAQLCVDVQGATTILQDLVGDGGKTKDPKKFTFDASFWSHDGFEELPGGYLKASPGSKYADQQLVFETFGKKVLDNAWEGYHCCLFAYGQTGAGKSYSMVGYGANRGIVPISCEEIFKRIEANADPNLAYEVTASMVEIYNEQVQDLLVHPRERPKKGLDIRESQQLGIYIAGVAKRPVDSYRAIEAVMEEGTENRTVGSTLMNATSSRAHTVITIEFKQVSKVAQCEGVKVSLINLVDLAGSEKAGQTGASGDRLKEGCAINKSLSALGNVIEKLADKAMGKTKSVVIPYRDSKLTRLLQNALGGSSKTVMICAISPASSNYEETLSTLRYADRAKRIKNSAVINENPQDKLIRQLREENAKLKEMIGEVPAGGASDDQSAEALQEKQAEIAALEDALKEMQKSFSDKMAEAQKAAHKREKEKENLSLPHIANLNEDDLLTNKLCFAFREGRSRIGRGPGPGEEGRAAPEVALAGLGIHGEHAAVANAGGRCVLSAASKEAAAATFVNGTGLSGDAGEGVALAHGDRVTFGQSIFVFVNPAEGKAADLLATGKVSYSMARKELNEQLGGMPSEEELRASREMAEELERRAREAEEAKNQAEREAEELLRAREDEFRQQMEQRQKDWEQQLQEKAQAQANDQAAAAEQARSHAQDLERLQQEFAERQQQAEQAAMQRIEELEKQSKKAAAEEEDHRQLELSMQRLEEQLMVAMPLVKEANLIAAELKRPHRLETKMHCELSNRTRGSVNVTAAVLKDGVQLFEWSLETLENRVFMMRDLLQRCDEEGLEVVSKLAPEDDPLWDPVEVERLIGVSQVLLEGLLLQVDNHVDARILSTEGHQAGTLRVEVVPLARDGSEGVPDEEIVDEPEELLGTRMTILVHVVSASDLPEALANDVRVEYNYFIDEKPRHIPAVQGHSCNPVFSHKQVFVQDPVTSRFLEYLQTRLMFRVYGRDSAAQEIARTQGSPSARLLEAGSPKVRGHEPEASPSPWRAESTAPPETPMATDASPAPDHAAQGAARSAASTPLPAHTSQGSLKSSPDRPRLPNVPDEPADAQSRTVAPSLGQVRRQQEATTAAAHQRGAQGSAPDSPPDSPSNLDQANSKACAVL